MLVVPSKKLIAISQMVQDIERDEEQFQFTENDDVFSISNILKQCTLRGLLTGGTAHC